MNRQEFDILNALYSNPYTNQRNLTELCGHSLGVVNRSINTLISNGYLDKEMHITKKALHEFEQRTPKNAIILAAGLGMRMVPINNHISKGMLTIHGEALIERIIRQLHEVEIREIYIVVGFMKEQYEYLIDKYEVTLIVNADYATKNNIHSLNLALKYLSNSYIIPCDIWCVKNPFSKRELYSWYMVSDSDDPDSTVRVNRKMELVSIPTAASGNAMIGICYLLEEQAEIVRRSITELCKSSLYNNYFWEEALYSKDRMIVAAKIVRSDGVAEINTYEQLREIDKNSGQLDSEAITIIKETLGLQTDRVENISVLKKGMTNRSFIFSAKGEKYIMRIPGEGTDSLINRKEETEVYKTIDGLGLCDSPIYINPVNGYKITRYLEDVRSCDIDNVEELQRCMQVLRNFHDMKLSVAHEFDIFAKINFYESLWNGLPSIYTDYEITKKNVFQLKKFIDSLQIQKVLTHIDAVPDNFLFYTDDTGMEAVQLTDWEYAAMQDPHVDIAMFSIYSMYDREQIDRLISLYFVDGCDKKTKVKIYAYISACGLLWSNWCEYKRNLGVEFGEYSLRQYRFAKEYYRIVRKELENMGESHVLS